MNGPDGLGWTFSTTGSGRAWRNLFAKARRTCTSAHADRLAQGTLWSCLGQDAPVRDPARLRWDRFIDKEAVAN